MSEVDYDVLRDNATLPLMASRIESWATDRDLLSELGDPRKQVKKTLEEAIEVQDALDEFYSYLEPDDQSNLPGFPEAHDACLLEIGDVAVTLFILARQMGSSLGECVELAYEKIRDRAGITVDGVFVKAEDLVG